jgi:hypothetical protein
LAACRDDAHLRCGVSLVAPEDRIRRWPSPLTSPIAMSSSSSGRIEN